MLLGHTNGSQST